MAPPHRRFAAARERFGAPWRGLAARDGVQGTNTGDAIALDERTLARLRRLTLVAGQARTEGLAGEHRSRRRGSSPEFADFKRYSPGDDFRRIDWNTYARLGGLFVRLSEVTTELSVHILLDSSASMDWRGGPDRPSKFTAARRLTTALAYVALWSFDRVSVVPFTEQPGVAYGPVQGRAQVAPTIRYLERLQPVGGTALATAVSNYARARSRPGLLLLISDFLSGDPEELQVALHDLRARGWQTAALHIVDLAELELEATSTWLRENEDGSTATSVELVDQETGALLRFAVDDDVLDRYVASMQAWLANLEEACRAEAAAYARVTTSWEIDDVTLTLLHERGIVA